LKEPAEAPKPLAPEDESALIRQAQGGDSAAFEALVKAYMKRAYYVALGLVGNHEDALDCSQEAFVKAYRALSRFRPEAPFFPWLYRITRNHCLNHLKKERRRRGLSLEQLREEKGVEFPCPRPDPRAVAMRSERDRALWRAIEGLKPDFREIILMRHFHQLAYKEIAQALEIPIGTVMSRLYGARRALGKTLERRGGDPA
jgi:RNA polymerase sigma-70 factor (ECF subfamily)